MVFICKHNPIPNIIFHGSQAYIPIALSMSSSSPANDSLISFKLYFSDSNFHGCSHVIFLFVFQRLNIQL